MALTMNQVPAALGASGGPGGLGQAAAVISAITGPLATSGADIFRTYSEQRQSAEELEQRQREFEAVSRLQAQQAAARQRAATIAEIAAIQRARVSGAYQTTYMPYVVGALALGGLALVAVGLLRKGS